MSVRSARGWAFITPLAGIGLLIGILIAIAELYGNASAGNEQIFILFAINLVLAVGLQAFMGSSGVVSFGHVAFMALAAYAAGLMTTPPDIKGTSIPNAPIFLRHADFGFIPGTLIAVAVTAIAGLIVGVAIVRLSGAAATIASYALLVIVQTLLVNVPSVTRGNQTFYGVPNDTTLTWAVVFGAVAIAAARLFQDSKSGLMLKATREDELASVTTGVNVWRLRLLAWVLSVAIVAAGGSLYAHFVTAFSPADFSLQLTFTVVTMVILGGRGVSGAFLGAVVVTGINQSMAHISGSISFGPVNTQAGVLTPIVLGLLVMFLIARRPSGVLGDHEVEGLIVRGMRTVRARRRRDRPVDQSGSGGPPEAKVLIAQPAEESMGQTLPHPVKEQRVSQHAE